MTPLENDPIWKLRHALLGISLALAVSVPLAAWLGAFIADCFADSYSARVACFAALLAYVLAGAVMLFVKVAQYETRALSARRFGLWMASLWTWPLLLARRSPPPSV